MTVTTRLYTTLFGTLVGQDAYGNKYYKARMKHAHMQGERRKEKRWVIYNGLAEPSKVPPEWHGWLHYTHDTPPNKQPAKHYLWEKAPQPNLTGTQGAYAPPGSLLKHGKRDYTTSDYQPWIPE